MTIRTLALLLLILALPPSLGGRGRTRQSKRQLRHTCRDRCLARSCRAGRRRRPAGPVRLAVHARSRSRPWAGCCARPSGRARGARAQPPQGRIRRIRLGAPGDGQIPVIALRRGYTTVLSFTGMTGAPWPIAETVLDSRFLPPGQEAAPEAAGAGHLLYLAPQQAYLDGNAVVALAGLAEPLVVALRGTGGAADFRVDIRLAMPGPNADPALLAQPEGFHAGDPVLLGLLGGAVPPDAERLAIEGGGHEGRAWRQGGDLLLVTRAYLLSPGPWAAERGPGGRWAYRLPDTPAGARKRERGREARLSFRSLETTDVQKEIVNEN